MSNGAPTLGGFINFVQTIMQPPDPPFDATTSPYVVYAYNYAIQWVYSNLALVVSIPGAYSLYAVAVYNLAADTLILFAQDQPSDPVYKDGMQYWQWLRNKYNALVFIPGVIQSTSDEGTSSSYMLPEGYKNFSIANLQNLKTPYGRQYVGIVQSWGSLWDIS